MTGKQGSGSAINLNGVMSATASFFNGSSVPNGTCRAVFDISAMPFVLNDNDTVTISWEMSYAADFVETYYSLSANTVTPAKPSTDPFKVTVHNDNSGFIITNADIDSAVTGNEFTGTYSFTGTMDPSNTPASTVQNKLRVISSSLEVNNHVFFSNIQLSKHVINTDDWNLNSGANNTSGTIFMPDGSSIFQNRS